jgi:ATP-dependent RNA helicase SUPV3L1/SUV3
VDAADIQSSFETAVIDECQMLADPQRGFAWTKAILGIQARRVHIIAAPHAERLLKRIFEHYHFSYEVIYHSRETSLEMEPTNFHFPKNVRAGDTLIVFSKRKVLSVAARLLKNGHKVSVLYGSMPPETRRMQMAQYREGKTDVLVSTDAIGMGLNLPINRVVFLETEKFDGKLMPPKIEKRSLNYWRKKYNHYEKQSFHFRSKRYRRSLINHLRYS